MARFYARFDSGSPSWNPNATTAVLLGTSADGFFQTRSIAATSASGALLRNGLIASRSAISTDIYVELDLINQSGGRGTYFPPDTFVVTSGVLTGSVYTSSVAGIVIPANYRTRPTASISSTSPLVTASSPPDSASVTYDVYLSGSTAVKNVLDGIVGGGPYSRLGNVPSRTLYSIWHDENLQYFAWDDFTPGPPSLATIQAITAFSCIDQSNIRGVIRINWEPTYLNDINPEASASVALSINNGSIVYSYGTVTLPAENRYLDQTITVVANGNIQTVIADVSFFDAVIKTSQGAALTASPVGIGINIPPLDCQDTTTTTPGGPVCKDPGTVCSQSSECCSLLCENGYCAQPCVGFNGDCTIGGSDCCVGYVCNELGKCVVPS